MAAATSTAAASACSFVRSPSLRHSPASCCPSVRSSPVRVGFTARTSPQIRSALAGDGPGAPAIPSGEWPENFSILNFEDLSKHYESVLFKEEAQPSTLLADVMSTTVYTAKPHQLLEEIDHHFNQISGLPVINEQLNCIGVLSKKDKIKATNGLKSRVKEVMTSPPITLSADKTVSDAAVLMLKNKVHRIPIVNGNNQVVGIVTRTDIFSALEGKPLEKQTISG